MIQETRAETAISENFQGGIDETRTLREVKIDYNTQGPRHRRQPSANIAPKYFLSLAMTNNN